MHVIGHHAIITHQITVPATRKYSSEPKVYLIFLCLGNFDQVLAMLFPVVTDIYLHRNIILIYAQTSG
jgi:hypothetical protein